MGWMVLALLLAVVFGVLLDRIWLAADKPDWWSEERRALDELGRRW